MLSKWFGSRRQDKASRAGRGFSAHPVIEGLESRLLLYSTLGANWTYGSRITYSFVPDGTNIGGFSSNLYATLNAKFSTATWQEQFKKAAAMWESYANINLVNVSDNGTRLAGGNYQQGDPNMGDIRISMVSLPSNQLAFTFLPPPINGGSDSGDIVFNSNVSWQINSNYDLLTVALHEFGHALGLDHSTVTTADMYPTYLGLKQAPTADDIAGIQAVYGPVQNDMFDSGGINNNSYTTATNITSYIGANSQIAIPGLNISSTSDTDWFYVTAPTSTTGTMTVTMQSANLSSLNPKVVVYNSSLGGLAQAFAANSYGATVTVSISGITAGQGFYIRTMAASAPGAVGAYGLLVNFGSSYQSPIAPPNTQVLAQADQGGGSSSQTIGPVPLSPLQARFGRSGGDQINFFDLLQQFQFNTNLTNLFGWGDGLEVPADPSTLTNTGIRARSDSTQSSPVSGGLAVIPLPLAAVVSTQPLSTSDGSTGAISSNHATPTEPIHQSPAFQTLDDVLAQWQSKDKRSLIAQGNDLDRD